MSLPSYLAAELRKRSSRMAAACEAWQREISGLKSSGLGRRPRSGENGRQAHDPIGLLGVEQLVLLKACLYRTKTEKKRNPQTRMPCMTRHDMTRKG